MSEEETKPSSGRPLALAVIPITLTALWAVFLMVAVGIQGSRLTAIEAKIASELPNGTRANQAGFETRTQVQVDGLFDIVSERTGDIRELGRRADETNKRIERLESTFFQRRNP